MVRSPGVPSRAEVLRTEGQDPMEGTFLGECSHPCLSPRSLQGLTLEMVRVEVSRQGLPGALGD